MLNFNHKAKVFKDAVFQQKLNDDGFVVLDFLTESETHNLLDFYREKHPEGATGFYTSTFSKDTDYRKKVDAEIRATMQRSLSYYFENYRVNGSSFIVKGPDKKSALKLHQDMTLVNESVYTGINIWIPLIDLNQDNGAIEVLPRSHRLFKTYRGASLPDIYDGIEKEVHECMQPMYLKAGQALVFDQSIIHYSPANKSNQSRPVINTFITHKDAVITICYWDKMRQGEIELFEQNDDFMINFQNFGHDIFSRPSIGRSIGFVPFNFPKITKALLQQEYGANETTDTISAPVKKSPFFNLFKKIFQGA